MKDIEIISLLHDLARPTFFTRDDDFFKRNLRHTGYCLVYTAVEKNEVAIFTRLLLKHPEFNTKAKRMGSVTKVSHPGLLVWRIDAEKPDRFDWPD